MFLFVFGLTRVFHQFAKFGNTEYGLSSVRCIEVFGRRLTSPLQSPRSVFGSERTQNLGERKKSLVMKTMLESMGCKSELVGILQSFWLTPRKSSDRFYP